MNWTIIPNDIIVIITVINPVVMPVQVADIVSRMK